jgi:hypothetical protein
MQKRSSRNAADEKAQQLPHPPWSLMLWMHVGHFDLALKDVGRVTPLGMPFFGLWEVMVF